MTNRIKAPFDGIRAEESLKTNTLLFLREQIQEKSKPRGFISVRRTAALLASLIVIVMGAFSYNLYFTESAYVDLDVNPSVELAVNRFDRVIGAHAYNSDGADILAEINIQHKDYRDAVGVAIDAMERKGFITDYGLVSVTLQTNNRNKESEMLLNIESTVRHHHGATQVNAFLVDGDTRAVAHDLNLSPAKYLAILELQEVDPTATIESCRDHAIGEIYRLTEEHSSDHHGVTAPTKPENDVGKAENNCPEDDRYNGNGESKLPQDHQSAGSNHDPTDKVSPSANPNTHHGENGGHGNDGGHD